MSTQRFTPEFKAEAVRQVIERGRSRKDCSFPPYRILCLAEK